MLSILNCSLKFFFSTYYYEYEYLLLLTDTNCAIYPTSMYLSLFTGIETFLQSITALTTTTRRTRTTTFNLIDCDARSEKTQIYLLLPPDGAPFTTWIRRRANAKGRQKAFILFKGGFLGPFRFK